MEIIFILWENKVGELLPSAEASTARRLGRLILDEELFLRLQRVEGGGAGGQREVVAALRCCWG